MTTASINSADGKFSADRKAEPFEALLTQSKAVDAGAQKNTAVREQSDVQAYENALNELAATMGDSVKDRTLGGLSSSSRNEDLYKTLVGYNLQEQANSGKQVSLDEAMDKATKDLRARYDNALKDDQDRKHKHDVLDGYWNNQNGKNDASALAGDAYRDFFGDQLPDTSNRNYDDNLNALAAGLVGGVNLDNRSVAIPIGTEGTLAQLYKNLVTTKLEEQGSPVNLEQASDEVEEELFERIGSAAQGSGADAGKVVDVIEGYWNKHAGKQDADALAREAADELGANAVPASKVSHIDGETNYDDTLNAVAAAMAEGVDLDGRTVTPFTDKAIRDDYSSLVYDTLMQQQKQGQGADLDAAYEDVKNDLYDRLPNALRDDPKAAQKMDVLDNYWDKSERNGKSDASDVAREAYSAFLSKNTVISNSNYEDNLNALSAGLGAGTIIDTRTLSGFSDPTLGSLYQNLITGKLQGEEGMTLDEAETAVKEDVLGRLGTALKDDVNKNEKIGIVENYWDDGKHAGGVDATRAAEAAYSDYVQAGGATADDADGLSDDEKKNLLAPSSTDVMNAETVGGETVNELYMDKLGKAYENEPKGSDKANFYLLLEAQNSLSGGFGYLPYYYENSTDSTLYADDTAAMSGADFQGLVDEEKLSAEIERLAQNPDIAADTQQYLSEAVGEIKDKAGLEQRIVSTMTSPTYQDELEQADLAQENGALARYSSDLNSLALLDQEKAQEVKLQLSMTSTMQELNRIIDAGPSGIDDSTLDVAIEDVALTTVKASVLGASTGKTYGELSAAFDEYMDGKKLEDIRKDGGKVLTPEEQTMLKEAKSSRDAMASMMKDALKTNINLELSPTDRSWQKAIDDFLSSDLDKKIDTALEKGKVPDTEKGKVGETLKNMSKDGVFGTVGGLVSIAAATLTLTNAGGTTGATTQERMGAAASLMTTVSSSRDAVNAMGDPLAKLLGRSGVTEALGLDKNGSDALKGRLGPEVTVSSPSISNPAAASKLYSDINSNIRLPSGNQIIDAFDKMPKGEQSAIMRSVDQMARSAGAGYANLSGADKLKLFGPGLKLIGSAASLSGAIMGVYLGADAVSNLNGNSTDLEKTQAALSLTAGLAYTGSAGAGLASWAGAAGAGTASAGLGAIGIVLSVVGLGVASAVKYDKQKEAADEVRDSLSHLEELGVMESDWGDKFNYLANVEYNYVDSSEPAVKDEWYEYYFPEDVPVWEAQPEQYEAFTKKGGETTKDWWSFAGGDSEDLLQGHGEEPEGSRYEQQPLKPSDFRG